MSRSATVLQAVCLLVLLLPMIAPALQTYEDPIPTAITMKEGPLPPPHLTGSISLEETLAGRRSVRKYAEGSLTREEIGQLLWAAQGVTREWGGRTAPSAGALYPLEIYVATEAGLYHYLPSSHSVEVIDSQDQRSAIGEAALGQGAIYAAPAVFVVSSFVSRTAAKYGDRATRYVRIEAGHAVQNLLLQATALGLGTVPIGAFYDDRLAKALGLSRGESPLYIVPVGRVEQQSGER